MRSMVKRILIGFLILAIVYCVFYIAVNYFKQREYKYMTLDNEWGISNKCYLDEDQFAICKLGDELVIVRQFYEWSDNYGWIK